MLSFFFSFVISFEEVSSKIIRIFLFSRHERDTSISLGRRLIGLIDRSEKIYTIYWAHIIINHEDGIVAGIIYTYMYHVINVGYVRVI